MKIRTNIFLTSLIVFFISSTSLAQTDTTKSDSSEFKFNPQFSCAQIEACVLLLGGEYGGVVDIDLFNNNNEQFIGIRFAFEKYGYTDIGGGRDGPFSDFCLYARPSFKYKNFLISVYGGVAYHIGEDNPWDNDTDEILPRTGLEAKYIPFGNLIGIMLKFSTSFKEDTGFVGLGIALGYFN